MAEIKQYKVKALPSTPVPNAIFYVKADTDTVITAYITDQNGIPFNLKDVFGTGVNTLVNSDGSITVVGTSNVNIKISASVMAIINSALQSGDNISELLNDAGYITALSLPTKTSDLINDGETGTSTYVETNELGAVAFSNDYNDLDNLPTIPSQYTDELAQDAVGNILTDTATINLSYNDVGNQITADVQANSITANELSNTIPISEFVNDEGFIDHIDLGYIASPTNGVVTSDTGTDATIPLVDNTNAGLQSPSDKIKLDGIASGSQVNVLETITSTGGTINVGANISKNINLEVVQATESQLGGGQVTTQAIIEDSATTNDTKIVTPKKWWQGWNKAVTLAWTWTLKQTFSTAIRLSSTTANTVPYIDGSKDVVSSTVTPTELGYLSGVTSAIQTQLNGKEPTITATSLITDFWSGNKTFRDLATDVRAVILIGFNSAITWARVTTSTTIQNAISLLQQQSNYLQATRFISGTGVTINAGDNTKFDIQVIGEIVDPITFIPTAINISLTAQTTTFIASQVESYIWVTSAGTVQQSLSPPIPTDFDVIIGYWVLVHSNLTNIALINSFPYYADGTAVKVAQILNFIGFSKFPNTNIATAGTTGTRIQHTGGFAIKSGLGNTTKRPVASLIGAVDPSNMEMRHRLNTFSTGVQNIDVTNYNPTGSTVSALSNNRFSVHKIWKFSSGLIRIQYGQTEYSNYNEAISGIDVNTFVDEGNAFRNGLHIGWLVFKKGTSWGTAGTGADGVDYKFVDVKSNGSTGGLTPTLQAAYDVSTLPQILINTIKGAFTLRSATGVNTDNIFQGQNNAGTTTSSVNGLGTINSASLTASMPLASDSSKNITPLTDAISGSFINGLTAKTTPVDADYLRLMDSADSNKEKKVSVLNLKSIIPVASTTVVGTVSIGAQSFSGDKTIVGLSNSTGNALTVNNLAGGLLFSVQNGKGINIQSVGNSSGDKYVTFGDSSGISSREVYFERVATSGGGFRIRTSAGTVLTIDGATANFGATVGLMGGANLFTGYLTQGNSGFNYTTRSQMSSTLYQFFIGAQSANPTLVNSLAYQIDTDTTTVANRQFSVMIPLKIGNTTLNNTSAILELESTTKGFLPSRMTATQAEAISSPAEGLLVYSTNGTGTTITTKGWWGYEGTNWVKLN